MAILKALRNKSAAPASPRRSTLALHGASVAMAPARSVTSHARRIYREQYAGRYRFSRLAMGFDLFLLGLMTALAIFDLVLLLGGVVPSDGGLALSFTAAPLNAVDEMPISIQLRSADGMTHEDVRLQWHVPDWVEIVRSEPARLKDGSIMLGRVAPGVVRQSLVVVRMRALTGVKVPFDVSVSQAGQFGFRQTVIGHEVRTIVSSAVSVEMPEPITRVVPGAAIPLMITNHGAHAVDSLAFRIVDGPGTVAGSSNIFLGSLAASSTRVIFVDLPPTLDSPTTVAWQVEDQARVIAASSTQLKVDQTLPFSIIGHPVGDLDSRSTLGVEYGFTGSFIQGEILFVLQQKDGSTIAASGRAVSHATNARVEFSSSQIASSAQWHAIPLVELIGGEWAVGKGSTTLRAETISFSAEARYYSASGDQIGVGPLAPQIGQSTRYWIVWSVDPGPDGLKDVTLSGALPPDAEATGQFASTVSGAFAAHGQSVVWTAPSIPPSTGQGAVTFAFEVELVPTVVPSASYYPLSATSTVEALDAKTGFALHAEAAGDDSRWLHDVKALNRAKKN